MAITITPADEDSLGCQFWASVSCTDTPDDRVTLPSGATAVVCLSCAERALDLAVGLSPSAGHPPF